MSTRADSENSTVQPIMRVFHPYYKPSHKIHTNSSESGVPKTTIIAFCGMRSGNHQYQDCSMQWVKKILSENCILWLLLQMCDERKSSNISLLWVIKPLLILMVVSTNTTVRSWATRIHTHQKNYQVYHVVWSLFQRTDAPIYICCKCQGKTLFLNAAEQQCTTC